MPLPNLIHPVRITIEQQAPELTVYDPRARGPVRQVARKGANPHTGDRFNLKGQVSYYFAGAKLDYPVYRREGVEEESIGYIVFRFIDMRRAGVLTFTPEGDFDEILIKRGDRIVYLGKRNVDFYVTGFKDFAHYPNLDQTLIQMNFGDRHPSSQQGDL
jgi:hypothetical protein